MQHQEQQSNVIDFFELIPLPYKHSCVTIGNFDGVHLGHQAIIRKMVRHAAAEKQPVIVITFFPDPEDFFDPKREAFYLTSPSEKNQMLCQMGVEKVLTFQFTKELAGLSARTFLSSLVGKLGMENLVIGRDFALGKDRQGTLPVIRELGKEFGFRVDVVERIDFKDQEVSSTRIRQFLAAGEVDEAAKLLGQPYQISGPVTHGSDRGSKIGLPTANIAYWPKKQLPALGVYVTKALLRGEEFQGITNVGLRPTFENQVTPNIETHLLDFDDDIYGEDMELLFLKKIRDEKKFSGVEAFLEQIKRDKNTAREFFGHE